MSVAVRSAGAPESARARAGAKLNASLPWLERKRCELALLDGCLRRPLQPVRPESVRAAIEGKFRHAARLKAERALERWLMTETARPPALQRSGAFAFSFGYQRADLAVQGPPIYRALRPLRAGWRESTIYTGSGMGAIAALLGALLQMNDAIEVAAAEDGYFETRELMASFGPRLRVLPVSASPSARTTKTGASILWVDSSVRHSFAACLDAIARGVDLIAFDTTCFWRSSRRIRRVVRHAMRAAIPIALIRSHGKLDSLGIEYGRLGSVVLLAPPAREPAQASRWTDATAATIRDTVRLHGLAPILAHFPPFESCEGYEACSALRTASIIRSTRRLARALGSRLPASAMTVAQHGLYLTIALNGHSGAGDIKRAVDEMAGELAADGLPVEHAGSFGFDFVAMEWCRDPADGADSIRVTGADLPPEWSAEIGRRIAAWWLRRMPKALPACRAVAA